MKRMITIDRKVLDSINEWASDYEPGLTTVEIRLNFSSGDMELYDYESGIVISKRPLQYFKIE